MNTSVLVIYTGGTIGMKQNPKTGTLCPFDFSQIRKAVPELKNFNFTIDTKSFPKPVDSSEINPDFWVRLVETIKAHYEKYSGFVILHGTDTMSYSASAVSFMLENLAKPVIFTGSQLPISALRTDGKENLLSAIEIAGSQKNGKPIVPEVCIFFENQLFRGNRTTKHSAENFNAFRSYNYPALAESGVTLKYNASAILKPKLRAKLKIHTSLDTNVFPLKIFPGVKVEFIEKVLQIKGLKAIVMETFGSGNAPKNTIFVEALKKAISNGLIVVNITQCQIGSVEMERYDTGILLKKIGVIGGKDMTFEAAITKLMFLLAENESVNYVKKKISESLRGEIL